MNNSQIKRAEMIALKSIGNNLAAGNQWHETERKIQMEPKFHSDGYPTTAAVVVLAFLLSCLIGALALANYCGVL